MRTHGMDQETEMLVEDFVQNTDFYVHLGKYIAASQ